MLVEAFMTRGTLYRQIDFGREEKVNFFISTFN